MKEAKRWVLTGIAAAGSALSGCGDDGRSVPDQAPMGRQAVVQPIGSCYNTFGEPLQPGSNAGGDVLAAQNQQIRLPDGRVFKLCYFNSPDAPGLSGPVTVAVQDTASGPQWFDPDNDGRPEKGSITPEEYIARYFGNQLPKQLEESQGIEVPVQLQPELDNAHKVFPVSTMNAEILLDSTMIHESLLPGASREYRCGVHDGVDIPAPEGTPLVAIAAGTVVDDGSSFNGFQPGERDGIIRRACEQPQVEPGMSSAYRQIIDKLYGIRVVIQHDDGSESLYAHLSRSYVTKGDRVSAGAQIGEIGMTGFSDDGPHLHLELFNPDGSILGAEYLHLPEQQRQQNVRDAWYAYFN